MKILILSNLASYTYNFRLEIIQAMKQKGWDIVMVFDNDSEEKTKALSEYGNLINVHFNGKGTNIKEELKLLKTYKNIIRETKPDAVLSFTIKMNLYGGFAAAKRKIPFFPMITGLGELEKEGKLQKMLTMFHKYVMPKAKCVFFQNEDNIAFFKQKGIRTQKSVLLPGSGVNLEKFSKLPYPPEFDGTSFAFIGRLTQAKGIEQYLDVASNLSSLATFYVAGLCDKQYAERVESMNAKGEIKYLGVLENTKSLLEKISCLILPTYHPEGMSNVLLEAGASARPAICTDRPGCKEIVKDGENGFYCMAKDSENLQSVVERFLALDYEEKKKMGERSREIVETNFDRNIVVKAYIDELENLK